MGGVGAGQEVGHVWGRGRRMSHAAMVRSELGEGMGHLWRAAGHAAGGMGGPAWRMTGGRLLPTSRMAGARRMMMARGAGMRGMAMRRMGMSPSVGAARRWGTRVA